MRAYVEFGSPISAREAETLRLYWRGLSTRDVADVLGVEVCTVKSHLHAIRRRWGVETWCEVIRAALERGVITLERAPREAPRGVDTPPLLRRADEAGTEGEAGGAG
jgi:DNA-binding CsgD family transcriptional regulator